MTFEQFEVAVGLLAGKKYSGAANGLERIKVKLLSGSGPTTHGATVSASFRGNVLTTVGPCLHDQTGRAVDGP